jgi:DNA-binding NarL/FixJ family response regulator
MTLVGEACNGREAIQMFRSHHPDVTLMDLQMPELSGLDALIAIRNEFPDAKVIVLTTYAGTCKFSVHSRPVSGLPAQEYPAQGALDTIRAVHSGKRALFPRCRPKSPSTRWTTPLTPAETSVLRLIAAGYANADRGSALGHGRNGQEQSQSILSKLGANDRTHAVTIGLKRASSTCKSRRQRSLPMRPRKSHAGDSCWGRRSPDHHLT